jgi:Flp pilus assembly CpaE family ATPase
LRVTFQADADVNPDIERGLRRRERMIDFRGARGVIPDRTPDLEVLRIAANAGRVLVSRDVRTMPGHFSHFVAEQESPGLLLIPSSKTTGEAIEGPKKCATRSGGCLPSRPCIPSPQEIDISDDKPYRDRLELPWGDELNKGFRMFKAILLVHDESASMAIENLAIESKQVSFEKTLSRFPQAFELSKLLNTYTPDLAFLDLSDWDSALAAAEDIRSLAPHTAIVGFGAGWGSQKEAQCENAGITELLVSPVTLQKFQDCVERAIHKMRNAVQENLLAFLPAKAGSGCTTIALNLAGYLSDTSAKDSLGKKVLLIEGDLHSGVLSVLLGKKHPYCLLDALEASGHLDSSEWSKYVVPFGGLDVLLSGRPRKSILPLWSNYHQLLDFAAWRYDHILVDLPEVVNDATVEIVRRAKRVFVTCTPEPTALALAPQRCLELTNRGIAADKIRVLLNRWHKGEATAEDVEGLLKYPVSAVFGNDYASVSNAARANAFVNPESKLGRSFAAFARMVAGEPDQTRSFSLAFLRGLGAKPAPQPHI